MSNTTEQALTTSTVQQAKTTTTTQWTTRRKAVKMELVDSVYEKTKEGWKAAITVYGKSYS